MIHKNKKTFLNIYVYQILQKKIELNYFPYNILTNTYLQLHTSYMGLETTEGGYDINLNMEEKSLEKNNLYLFVCVR